MRCGVTLEFEHFLCPGDRGDRVADSPAGHCIGFRKTSSDTDEIPQFLRKTRTGENLRRRIHEEQIALISYYIDPAFGADLDNLPHLLGGNDAAGGIARGIHDQKFRLRSYRRFDLVGVEDEVRLLCFDVDDVRSREIHYLREGHPIWFRYQDVVTRTDERTDGIEECLLSSAGRGDFGWRDVCSEPLPVKVGDRFRETFESRCRCVFGDVLAESLRCEVLYELRCRKVGFTECEVDDIKASLSQCRRGLHRLEGRRGVHLSDTL